MKLLGDVAKGTTLMPGNVVSFYLYADEQGIGAECCQLEKNSWPGTSEDEAKAQSVSKESSEAPSFRADADEFVPGGASQPCSWNLCASEFVPTSTTTLCSFSAEAPEFVPCTMNSTAKEFVPITMNIGAQEFVPSPATNHSNFVAPSLNVFAFNLALLSDSDDESDDDCSVVSEDLSETSVNFHD